MIDVEAAELAQSKIKVGDTIEYWTHDYLTSGKVIDKTTYSVGLLLNGNTKLTIPVEHTEIYRKELEMRTLPEPPKRGRPKVQATGPQAAYQPPSNTYLPPGSHEPTVTPSTGTPPVAVKVAEPMMLPNDDEATAALRTFAKLYIDNILAEATEKLHALIDEHMHVAMERSEVAAPEPVVETPTWKEPEKVKTCHDCENFNDSKSFCNKFQMTPPDHVIQNAQKMCDSFEEIPF